MSTSTLLTALKMLFLLIIQVHPVQGLTILHAQSKWELSHPHYRAVIIIYQLNLANLAKIMIIIVILNCLGICFPQQNATHKTIIPPGPSWGNLVEFS